MNVDRVMKKYAPDIWKFIHIAALAFTPTQESKRAFRCFVLSIAELIPYTTSLSIKFFNIHKVENYMESSDELFKWTWLWHNFINKENGNALVSLDKIKTIYNIKSIDKKVWGNACWNLIHTLALMYPTYQDYVKFVSFKCMMTCLTIILPCPACKQHMIDNLMNHPLDINNQGLHRDRLFRTTVDLHNAVNKQLNSPVFSYEESYAYYTK